MENMDDFDFKGCKSGGTQKVTLVILGSEYKKVEQWAKIRETHGLIH